MLVLSMPSGAAVGSVRHPAPAARVGTMGSSRARAQERSALGHDPRVVRLRRGALALNGIVPAIFATDGRPQRCGHVVLADQTSERAIRERFGLQRLAAWT